MRRLFTIVTTVLILMVATAIPVLAAVSDITVFTATATSTTISFRLDLPSGATSSVVRYSTTAYPPTRADGTGVTMTNKYYATVTGLAAGTTYYFSAWGWDEAATYSATAKNYMITTPITSSATIEIPPDPALPGDMAAAPVLTGIDVYPFDLIITNLNSAPGGLGLPTTTSWEFIICLGIAIAGVAVYIWTKSEIAGNAAAIMLSYGAWQGGLIQLYGVVFFIIFAFGMWGLQGIQNRG